MKLRLQNTAVKYARKEVDAILVTEGEKGRVYIPDCCASTASGLILTCSPTGVMAARIADIKENTGNQDKEIELATDPTPTHQLARLLELLECNDITIIIDDGKAVLETSAPGRTVTHNDDVLSCLTDLFDMFNLTDKIKRVEINPMEVNEVKDAVLEEQLTHASNVVNEVFRDVLVETADIELGVDCTTIRIEDFGDINIKALDGEDVEVHVTFKHPQHYSEINAHQSAVMAEAFKAYIRYILSDDTFAVDGNVDLVLELAEPVSRSRGMKDVGASIRDVTHRADVRFKLPVTPVLYNYTNLQIEVDGARVVVHNSHIRLQDTQYEGDPVIGVVLDFNHPIAGLNDLKSVRSRNPNLPIYILWNSDEGPVLELYNA